MATKGYSASPKVPAFMEPHWDCLESYLGHSLGESYPSAEMQPMSLQPLPVGPEKNRKKNSQRIPNRENFQNEIKEDALNLAVIVIRNEIDDSSSNPGWELSVLQPF